MILQRYQDTVTGQYDFAADGGAIGNIDLGVPIPINSLVYQVMFYVVTLPTSATNIGTISFGQMKTSVSPVSPVVGSLFAALIVSSWGAGTTKVGTNTSGAPSGPFKNSLFSTSVMMSIAVEALTAGKIQFAVSYIGFDF